jgi:methyl-accepting chemotaxis protein
MTVIRDQNTGIYEALLQESEDAVLVMDEGGNVVFWNKGAESLWGYSSSEAIGKNIENYINNIDGAVNKGSKEIIIEHKDGTKLIGLLSINQIQKEDKVYSMASVKCITSHKEVENNLSNLKNVVDTSFAKIEFDPKGTIIDANQNFADILEYDASEKLLGRHHSLFVTDKLKFSKDYIQFWGNLRKGIIQKGEFKRVTKNNKHIWIQAVYTPLKNTEGKVVKIIEIAMDITSQKEIILNADGLKNAIDVSFAQIEFSPEGKILSANEQFIGILGYDSSKDLIGKDHSLFIEDIFKNKEKKYEEANKYAELWRNLRKGITQNGEFKQINKEGEFVWIKTTYTPIKNSFGEVIKIIQIAVDITNQKRMILDMQGLKDTIDASFAKIEFDLKGNILTINENFANVLEYETSDELIGKHHALFVEEDYRTSDEYIQFWEDLENGMGKKGEFRRVTEEGKIIWLLATYTPVKDINGDVTRIIKIASDISAQKQIITEINNVVRSAGIEGKLDTRLELDTAKGDWKKLGDSVNLLLESVANPVIEINRVVEQMAQGNLVERFELEAQGDLKELGNSLNVAIGNLNALLGQIAEVGNLVEISAKEMLAKGEEMRSTTQEVASATQQMAQGAMNQAEETDQASQLMADVLQSSNGMAEKSVRINEAAGDGQKNSLEGLKSIKLVGDNMDEIQRSAANTSDSIMILAERSEEISFALRVITDIAAQTNLLALNAAIEAARAGDSGRGFAVVAEEIRKLAEGSRKSAVDIEKVIREVQKDILTVAKAIETMSVSVESGTVASKEAEEVFGNIEKANHETLDLSKEILEATVEQIEFISTSVKNIENIVVVAEETASGAEEVASSGKFLSEGMNEVKTTSEDLAKVANQLQESISKFKLK